MKQKKKETDATYWHPAFYAGIQIELEDDADNLVFESEHQLGKKPKWRLMVTVHTASCTLLHGVRPIQ